MHGWCICSAGNLSTELDYERRADAIAVLEPFFVTAPAEVKAAASFDAASTSAGPGRGYFCMPGKEVLGVGLGWRPPQAAADLRLAAATLNGITLDMHQQKHNCNSSSEGCCVCTW
jgi:hypothetical protein